MGREAGLLPGTLCPAVGDLITPAVGVVPGLAGALPQESDLVGETLAGDALMVSNRRTHRRGSVGDTLAVAVVGAHLQGVVMLAEGVLGGANKWAEVLAMYVFQWQYRPGRTNVAYIPI